MKLENIAQLPHNLRLTIPPDYLDIFDHMNVQYYLKIFNDTVFDMFEDFGMTELFFRENELAMYAVDQRLSFMSEVKVGETVSTYSRLIGRSAKSLHFKLYMINETQNVLASSMEGLGFHVSKKTKRSTPFLEEISAVIDQRIEKHQALDWKPRLSEAIRLSNI